MMMMIIIMMMMLMMKMMLMLMMKIMMKMKMVTFGCMNSQTKPTPLIASVQVKERNH